MPMQFKNNKKFNLTKKIVLVGLVLLIVLGGVFISKPKQIQAVEESQLELITRTSFFSPGFPVKEIALETETFLSKIWNAMKDLYNKVGAVAFKEGLKRIVSNIAYDTATWIATGDKAQAPMFQTNFVDYIRDEADAYLGDALNNQLSNQWGINLCEPLDPLVKVRFEIAVRNYFRSPRPQCTFTKMWQNIQDARRLKLIDLPSFADIFNPSSNELGMFLQVTSQIQEEQREKIELLELQTQIEEGWKSVTSKITGDIKTPAAITALLGTEPLKWSFQEKSTFTGELAADFIGVFTNTLISKLIQKYKQGLVSDEGRATGGLGGTYGPSFGRSAIQAARERFAGLGEPEYNFGGAFDLISQLSCENTEGQYACTINEPFRAAIMEEPHLTVREALDRELLYGNRAFGYRSASEGKSGGTADANGDIYSYRSLVILRKYRIIPVGWELAAEYYRQYDDTPNTSLTLNKLIKEFDDPDSPYYRLVDPDWVLKAPDVICEKEGPGELAADETIAISVDIDQDGEVSDDEKREMVIRKSYCADERTCIQESADGSQCEYYGYCTKEQSIWRVTSENGECAPIYNTCRAYVTRDNQQVGYLYNTLWGKDFCTAADVGCREYCIDWNLIDSEWACDESGGERMYLNRYAAENECSQDEVGCSEFIRLETAALVDDNMTSEEAEELLVDADGVPILSGVAIAGVVDYDFSPKINLRKAPDYLDCEEYTNIVGGDQASCSSPNLWRDDIQACVEGGDYMCNDYALYCQAEDEGCRFYNPVSYQGPSVPGVVDSTDMCPAECVGYKSYMEQPSFLERILPPGRNPLNFIASTAQTCPAVDNGCEEFTNLSEGPEGERKEYYSAIRSCILPDNGGTDTYYSWTSTDEAGNQLRSWVLLETNNGGAPCTNSETNANGVVTCTDNLNTRFECTFGNSDPELNPVYNPDCIEFIDTGGNSYWMLYSRVIFVSEDCVSMRRTNGQGIYSIDQSRSQTCAASSVGCREYKGSAANNIQIILNDDFDNPATLNNWQGGSLSNESLIANGHSLSVVATAQKDITALIHQNRSYKLAFWARGSSIGNIVLEGSSGASSAFSNPNNISDDWGYYVVDLINLNRALDATEQLVITGNNFYLDNIILTETQDDLYLIRDSWNTPSSCEEIVDGKDMIGCEHYRDDDNKNWYLRSFTKLCRDELVGCELMIDTYNSTSPAQETYNDVVVPPDDLKYLVYDDRKLCSDVGCMILGLREPSRDNQIIFSTQYLVVNADDYGGQSSPLCTLEGVWCDEFRPINGGAPVYFKNPNVETCEYKEVGGNYAWYQTGSDTSCPTYTTADSDQGHCLGGRSTINSELESNLCFANTNCVDYASFSSPGWCSSWVGVCPVNMNSCTEYQDPSSPENCDKLSVNGEDSFDNQGELIPHCDFYYYMSDKVTSCSEEDLKDSTQSCRPFHQTDGGANVWYSTARCSGDTSLPCETNADCVDSQGNSLGVCTYIPPATGTGAGGRGGSGSGPVF